jgi:hypothetical protein
MRCIFLFLSFAISSAAYSVAQGEPAKVTSQVNCFISSSGKKVCDLTVKLIGEIVATSANEVALLLSDAEMRTDFWYKQLSIDSPGGSLNASMATLLPGTRATPASKPLNEFIGAAIGKGLKTFAVSPYGD